ncbi:hypothetical protein HI846_01100 [Micrococcus luteus]|uniref:hypothetical protein n=1 Tax=Micrococcus luteus TaxID=1270 RepID=UPI0014806D52|nr:hypothetical protein [Micrococcus luteus]MBU8793211.1 hypothetical protein [Micrococcus luteus]NNM48553.1 hypothetical protein [Micrococcus luteus]
MSDPVLTARSRLAVAARAKASPAVLAERRRDLTTAKLARAIEEALTDPHPPRASDLHRLSFAMIGGRK